MGCSISGVFVKGSAIVAIYGIVEFFPDSVTTLRAGGSYEANDHTFVPYGVPHFDDGSDAGLARSTALAAPWNRADTESVELFGQLERRFGRDWVLKVNGARLHQTNDSKYAYVLGTINPVTHLVGGPSAIESDTVGRNLTVDATLTGAFDLFGRRHEITLGADHSHISSDIPLNFLDGYVPPFDPFTSDLNDLQEPTTSSFGAVAKLRRNQYGVMGALRLHPADGLSLIGGGRFNWLDETLNSQTFFFGELLFEDMIQTKTKGKFVPYGGIVYELSPNYSIYVSYADIYNPQMSMLRQDMTRLPSALDGVNIEAGIKGSWRNGTLNGSLALFRIRQTGGSVQDPSIVSPLPDCCYLEETNRSEGVELELSGKLAAGWWLTAGYTYNKNETVSELASDGLILSSQTPKHLFKLWTSYDLPGALKSWTIGGGIVAKSASYVEGAGCPRFDALGNCAPGENPATPFNVTQKAYAVVDLRVAYEIDAHWSAALSANNIFDKRYYQNIGENSAGYSNAWYGIPRNILLND
ncbi:TonB-dependent siderophore receptor [Sphingobium lactosutens]|uniref:TonB-dependent receptor-like beta-barrel domain-containing protein n=1 Tax=Sphingobium lactosutens DS20 TaxID=1331060 RepID=T0IZ67_9SPHN|nr:TonB-dependent receptor [Sphingobium lactosutens]EQB14974.1 hypothetical protein RLDS_12450 [Sphingobium lactosutens DS20]